MATKAEIIVMGEDLFKRLGGNRTKDGRIVRALLAGYKSEKERAALENLFQACSKLCVEDMDTLQDEINEASKVLSGQVG